MKKGPANARLSAREKKRYARNLLIDEWRGEEGQKRLRGSTVLVVGAGGSGSSLLFYLAAAGVGNLRVCDGDKVALDNLNRQIIHDERRIGVNKARSACSMLRRLNSDISVITIPKRVDIKNLSKIAAGCDLICCAADDIKTMKLLGRFSGKQGVPVIWAGGYYMGGFLTFVEPPLTPCIECYLAAREGLIEKLKKGSAGAAGEKVEKGVLKHLQRGGPNPVIGAAAGAAGAIQAMEAIKYLAGFGANLRGLMLTFQLGGAGMIFDISDINGVRRKGCDICGINSRD